MLKQGGKEHTLAGPADRHIPRRPVGTTYCALRHQVCPPFTTHHHLVIKMSGGNENPQRNSRRKRIFRITKSKQTKCSHEFHVLTSPNPSHSLLVSRQLLVLIFDRGFVVEAGLVTVRPKRKGTVTKQQLKTVTSSISKTVCVVMELQRCL